MFCGNCGTELSVDSRFCARCGQPNQLPHSSGRSRAPIMATRANPVLAPPSLHWFFCLLIAVLTGDLFFVLCVFVQSSWIKKIDPQSRATRDYILGLALP